MFLGHFAAGFAAKRLAPRPSLGTLFMASQFIDLLWPLMLILGLEQVRIDPGHTVVTPLDFAYYPYTHSLAGVLAWSLAFGGVYFFLKRDRSSAIVLGCLVLSHWFLDTLVHTPDLPLVQGIGPMIGLGIWNSLPLTLIIELLPFLASVALYAREFPPASTQGKWALWSLTLFLFAVYLANVFGPVPESADAIGYAGLSQWILVAWGYWIGSTRRMHATSRAKTAAGA